MLSVDTDSWNTMPLTGTATGVKRRQLHNGRNWYQLVGRTDVLDANHASIFQLGRRRSARRGAARRGARSLGCIYVLNLARVTTCRSIVATTFNPAKIEKKGRNGRVDSVTCENSRNDRFRGLFRQVLSKDAHARTLGSIRMQRSFRRACRLYLEFLGK